MRKLLPLFIALWSCGADEDPGRNNNPPELQEITINPTVSYQEMTGFGGALTWYSDRLVSSNDKNTIAQLLFEDLGTDIVRFQAWYYPDNYPINKSPAPGDYDNSYLLFNTTNQIYDLMNDHNPDIKILLSSWGPPAGLKSNNNHREGTLMKDDNGFVYDAFAQYWEDILNYHTQFTPDFISIQNEPSYTNPGWTTCEWAATETAVLPGYDIAFDKVYEKIKDRANPPLMLGPESPNTNTFSSFAEALKNKDHLGMFGYHPYNINSSTSSSQVSQELQAIKTYNTRPNLMTEFSDNLSWFNTAVFINRTLTEANSSGYIYWKLVWAAPSSGSEDAAIISIGQSGNYTVTPFYYLLKHFAKHIDSGYKRIDVQSENAALLVSGFVNPAQDKITLIVVNPGSSVNMDIALTSGTIDAIEVIQSKQGSLYKTITDTIEDGAIKFDGQSITTIVLDL
jgi:O-glycosyl hydrolase